MDEYDYLYQENYGFEFTFYGTRVGRSKPLSWYRVKLIPDGKGNGDDVPLFVKCKKCGSYMNFSVGWYQCESCGKRIKERTLFTQLDRETREQEKEYDEYWD